MCLTAFFKRFLNISAQNLELEFCELAQTAKQVLPSKFFAF